MKYKTQHHNITTLQHLGMGKNNKQDVTNSLSLIKAVLLGLILPLTLHGLWMRHLIDKHYLSVPQEEEGGHFVHPVIADVHYERPSRTINSGAHAKSNGDQKQQASGFTQQQQGMADSVMKSELKSVVSPVQEGVFYEDDDNSNDGAINTVRASDRPESLAKKEYMPERQTYDSNVASLRIAADAEAEKVKTGSNDINFMIFVELGNTLFIRERMFGGAGGGNDTPEIVWAYNQVLKIIIPLRHLEPRFNSLACVVNGNMGEALFTADMFEESTNAFTTALLYDCDDHHVNKLTYYRGNNNMIMGKYDKAVEDFVESIRRDDKDVHYWRILEKLTRILDAEESAVPGGWEWLRNKLLELLPVTIHEYEVASTSKRKDELARAIQLVQYSLFNYYDKASNNSDAALYYLDESQKWKRRFVDYIVPDGELEHQFMIQAGRFTRNVLKAQSNFGLETRMPIFVLGFPRSGTTLLERILDAHPDIFGLGERSVMAAYAPIAQEKLYNGHSNPSTVSELANEVASQMRDQCRRQKLSLKIDDMNVSPRLVDKQNMNYNNIAFIHTLFPNALILHVVREPMDVLFSNYKHDFMGKNLALKDQDYTCEFESLSEFYKDYRKKMDHWDAVLPGRITHIRYEDLVYDMPGVARSVISAAGLDWKNEIFDFHKKKHAVNTYSATQVRKGVYSGSIQSWQKYKDYLQPLKQYVGQYAQYEIKTNLPGYVRQNGTDEL